MAYASSANVAATYGTLTAAELTKVTELLHRAEALVLGAVPSIPARIAAGTLLSGLVASVEAAMVERVLRNPDGKRQVSRSSDDFTHSWTIDSALSSGALYLSDDERAQLEPAAAQLAIGTMQLGIGLR